MDARDHRGAEALPRPVSAPPVWLVEARDQITLNLDEAVQILEGQLRDIAPHSYWAGYYDACRHALKSLPPHVKYPDDEDWLEEGYEPPEAA